MCHRHTLKMPVITTLRKIQKSLDDLAVVAGW
jgi:hypothetical protein